MVHNYLGRTTLKRSLGKAGTFVVGWSDRFPIRARRADVGPKSAHDPLHHLTRHIRQAEVPAAVAISQLVARTDSTHAAEAPMLLLL